MNCSNCGSNLEEGMIFCPICGHRIEESQKEGAIEETRTEMTDAAAPVYSPIPPDRPQNPKKKGKGLIVLGVIAALLVVAGVVVALNFAKVSNWAMKTFSSPQKYYQWVEKKSIEENAALAADVYGEWFSVISNYGNQKVESDMELELSDATVQMLGEFTNSDFSWMKSIGMNMCLNQKDEWNQMQYGMNLNKEKVASVDVLYSTASTIPFAYMAIPELSEKYLKVDYSGVTDSLEYEEYMQMQKKMLELIPDEKIIGDWFDRYGKLILMDLDKVEMVGAAELSVNGISQQCTELDVTLDAENVLKILKDFVDEMEKDKEMREMYQKLIETANDPYMAQSYDEIIAQMKETLEIADPSEAQFCFVMKIFVDDTGIIKGRHITVNNSSEAFSCKISQPTDGDKVGFEAEVSSESTFLVFSGQGTEKQKKFDGTFSLSANGVAAFDITVKQLDTEAFKKGHLDGKFEMSLGKGVAKTLEMGNAYVSLKLLVDVESDKNFNKVVMRLTGGDMPYGTLTVTTKFGEGEAVKEPQDAITIDQDNASEALIEYVKTIDRKALLLKLRKYPLPEDFMEDMEEFADADLDDIFYGYGY